MSAQHQRKIGVLIANARLELTVMLSPALWGKHDGAPCPLMCAEQVDQLLMPGATWQSRSNRTSVGSVHLDGRKAVVAVRTCGPFLCAQAPVRVFSAATGELLAEHGCGAL